MTAGNGFKWSTLLAHSHSITFTFNGKSLRICARCLGVIVGFAAFSILTATLQFQFFMLLPIHVQILLCIILATPAIFDWVTQTWGLRESNNKIRFLTGIFEAGGAVFLWLTSISVWNKIFILMFIAGATLHMGFFRKKWNR